MTKQSSSSGWSFDAVIFDLDGVITQTALVHSAAWKKMFDQFMKGLAQQEGAPFREFTRQDYLAYVDGKPRYEGVESFLASRDITLPHGDKNDDPKTESICGLGNRKNLAFREVLEKDGVEVYPSTIRLVRDLKKNGILLAVASSSKNCKFVLESAGISDLFETRVDGVTSVELGLKGKPEADIFIKAAQNLGTEANRAVVVEDAVSGVQAGRNGSFGLVIGLAREDNADELSQHGADVVLEDFGDTTTADIEKWFQAKQSAS